MYFSVSVHFILYIFLIWFRDLGLWFARFSIVENTFRLCFCVRGCNPVRIFSRILGILQNGFTWILIVVDTFAKTQISNDI